MIDPAFEKWQSQLRKGFLELCVLVILEERRQSYGLELLHVLEQSGLDVREGTLYPLLNRLHKSGWLESNWETPVDGGHPRRFYKLSAVGKNQLAPMLATYQANTASFEHLVQGSLASPSRALESQETPP